MARNVRQDAKIETARRFRKKLTKPELWLWLRLKERSADIPVFRSQHPVGSYILDFYCPKAKLCIEVDGEFHTHHSRITRDEIRDAWLEERGIYVHRIAAGDLLANPDETASSVVVLALDRIAELAQAPPTICSANGPPSP